MAAADGAVERLLATKTATPIAQLAPELPDQATRKVHGEVTITWPFSSVTNSLAFLLAEPDFRLRRDKGQVRVQLSGPSAEAVGALELGSGDEVTLGLEGAEWARDEEPARAPGSRADWQLKFAGKLALKVTLGETQETRFIQIDQPLPTEPDEVYEPIPYSEIDITLFDDGPLVPNDAKPALNEYASPVFVKRSRASYAPLFEFDLDEELEADGGRRGKGRKRPRYSVQNGRWRYREESSSPEPDMLQDSHPPDSAQDGDVEMRDIPPKPQMADEACQTSELELPPPPQSGMNTPFRGPAIAATSSSPLGDTPPGPYMGATTNAGIQVSESNLRAAAPPRQQHAAPAARSATDTFAPAQGAAVSPEFGMSSLHSAQSNQQTTSSPPGGEKTAPNQPGSVQPTHFQAVFGQSVFGQTGFGQPSHFERSLGKPSDVATGFGIVGAPPVESVRFGFGEQPQSTLGGMPFASSQTPFSYREAHHQSEAYPDPQQQSATASPPSHHSSGHVLQHSQPHQATDETRTQGPALQTGSNETPLWAQQPGQWHTGHDTPEETRSYGSASVGTPQGMIPPRVEDGTRNRDEIKEQGILSRPIFEQGVSREAVPHGRESSADEDENSMDSDEAADYDEDEKGDDYDMRNYDSISDDDEGLDPDRTAPLPDEDLLEEDEDLDDEEDYDEEDEYEQEEEDYPTGSAYRQPMAPTAPVHQVLKEPIIIDLLSDSDNDEEEAPPPPKSQLGRYQMDGIAKSEPEDGHRGHLVAGILASNLQPRQRSPEPEQELEESNESAEEEAGGTGRESLPGVKEPVDDDESGGSGRDEPSGDDGDTDVDDPTDARSSNDVEPTSDIEVPYRPAASVPVEEAHASSGQSRSHSEDDDEPIIDETIAKVDPKLGRAQGTQLAIGRELGDGSEAMGEEKVDTSSRAGPRQLESIGLAGSFQTQRGRVAASFETQAMGLATGENSSSPPGQVRSPATPHTHPVDLSASFRTQAGDVAASFQSQVIEVPTSPKLPSSPQRQGPSPAVQDTPMEDVDSGRVNEDRVSGSKGGVPGEEMDEDGDEPRQPSVREPELSDEDQRRRGDINEAEVAPNVECEVPESKSFDGFSDDPRESPPSPPQSQHREGRGTMLMDFSMTTVSSQVETQATEVTIVQTQETNVIYSQPDAAREGYEMTSSDRRVFTTEVEAMSFPGEIRSDAELAGVPGKRAVSAASDGEDFHDASELLHTVESPSAAQFDDRASFVTAKSRASESRETEEAESPSARKSKRSSRIRALREESSIQFARPTRTSRRGSRVLSDQSPSPRATRSQTMSFQKNTSPPQEQEDMFARAGLRSPSRRKTSATTASKSKSKPKPKADLVKRLGTEMPECAPLKDLKTYNMNTLDVAAVVTSTSTTPQRTKTRQYVSTFTICDPSTSPQGVTEVSVYRAHKDYLPVVRPGDSVLLRRFTVTSLPERGFGLKTEDESSWAVLNTDGEDATPQVRGPPVELSEKEKKYLVDMRAWYAALDVGSKDKLAAAVGGMVQKGKESRGET